MLDGAVEAGLEAAAVEMGEGACDFGGDERVVARCDEKLRDAPDVLLGGHPVLGVQAGQVDGYGVVAQGALAA